MDQTEMNDREGESREMQKQKGAELLLILGLIVFALGCIFFSNTGSNALGMANEHLTPNKYSNILSIGLLISIVFQAVNCVRKPAGSVDSVPKTQDRAWILICFTVCVSILYVFGMSKIGFYSSTVVGLFVINMTFEGWKKESLWKALVFSVGVCMLFYFTFGYLKVFLPKTIFF